MGRVLAVILFFNLLISNFSFGQWEWNHPYPQGHSLYDIYFVDADNAWACGKYGTIIFTSDGGQTWEPQTSGTYKNLYRISFGNLKPS